MTDNILEFRNAITLVLNRSGFYLLSLNKLTQLLKLLEMPESIQPKSILESTFIGIIKLYEKFKDNILPYVYSQKFNFISRDIKDFLINIISQIHQIILSKQQAPITSLYNNSYFGLPYQNNNNLHNPLFSQSIPTSSEQMRKYIESSKLYSYFMMNQNLSQSLHNPLNAHMNLTHLNLNNPYLGMNSPSQLGIAINSMKNLPISNFSALSNTHKNYSYHMYPGTSSISSLIPSQFMSSYPINMMNGLNQIPQPNISNSFSFDKPQNMNKPSFSSQYFKNPSNENINKKMNNVEIDKNVNHKHFDNRKSIQKQKNQTTKLSNPRSLENVSKNLQKAKQQKNNNMQFFLPKKLPFQDTKKLQNPNQEYKNCACRGFYEYEKTFSCHQCKKKLHYRCLGFFETHENIENIVCAHCQMRVIDPLNKVQKVVSQYYIMNISQHRHSVQLNFKLYEQYFKERNSKYEIEVRCVHSGQHLNSLQITWPDECIMKINEDTICEITALQSHSSLKKRKDHSIYLPLCTYRSNLINEDKVYFSLQIKSISSQQLTTKKIRNQYTFAFGIYLVQKLNSDELYAKVMDNQHIIDKDFFKKVMDSSENQVEIDKITIKLLDPYTWDLIKTPVRGSKCSHIQCFDLKSFISLMYSAKNRTWRCPLCSKDSRKFILDQQQLNILKKAQLINPTPKQVLVYKQGQIAFKIQKQNDDEDSQKQMPLPKTKKIHKQKKEQIIKQT